jgi:hypothetical protein
MTTSNEIILKGPENYHSWFSNIKGSVPEDLWKYFDPEIVDLEYVEPELNQNPSRLPPFDQKRQLCNN